MNKIVSLPVPNIPRLHSTPLASISIRSSRVIAEVDDVMENRFRLVFDPFQAVRITTADCYIPPDNLEILCGTVIEVLHSSWLSELSDNLKKIDESANFISKARHFLVPLQDDFLEVIAWDIKFSGLMRSCTDRAHCQPYGDA